MVVAAGVVAMAAHVRIIYFFLCRAARASLVLVGSGTRIRQHARRCLEKTLHHGGYGCLFNDDVIGSPLHQGLDAAPAKALAAGPQTNLSDWVVVDPALLVAQIRQK